MTEITITTTLMFTVFSPWAVKNVNSHYESSLTNVGKKDIYACIINIQMNTECIMKAVLDYKKELSQEGLMGNSKIQ